MYFFYLDESGNTSLSAKSLQDSPYFILAALGLHESNWRAADNYLTELKKTYFPSDELKSNEFKAHILRKAVSKAGTSNPYWPHLTKNEVLRLVSEIYDIFDKIPFTMFFAAINKRTLITRYTNPYPPYAIAFALIQQTIARFLRALNPPEQGVLIVDENKEVEDRLGNYNSIVARLESSSPRPAGLDILIEAPFFVNSRSFQVIQLSDLCAYSVLKAVSKNHYDYEYFKRIEPYIFKQTLLFNSHGVIIFPAWV